MAFDEIIETANYNRRETYKIEELRKQRDICLRIIGAIRFRLFKISDRDEKFVMLCNRTMSPVSIKSLERLRQIEGRI